MPSVVDALGAGASKFLRAVHHNETLRDAIKAWTESNPASLEPIERLDGSLDLVLRWNSEPPLADWAIVLGDVIHNLRASLDHVVWARSSAPTSRTAFPIHPDQSTFDGQCRRQLASVPQVLRDAIVAMRVFPGGSERGDRLWELHQLDVQDKHHLILPMGMVQTGVGIPWPDFGPGFKVPDGPAAFLRPADHQYGFADGAVMMRFQASGRDPSMESKTLVRASVALSREAADNGLSIAESVTRLSLEVENTLREMAKL